jgi:hypothetical protein
MNLLCRCISTNGFATFCSSIASFFGEKGHVILEIKALFLLLCHINLLKCIFVYTECPVHVIPGVWKYTLFIL